jgi:ubiquinone/menaquinone biosynthesis C-methylase UbiE
MSDAQIEYWNGPAAQRWVSYQLELDRALAPFGTAALERAAVQAGQHVLDVGCGCGATSLALAQNVTRTGAVLGLDISSGMLARAREHAAGLPQLRFHEGDAASFVSTPEAGAFDVVFSRFGVMFFADPTAAFAHLRTQLRAKGRCVFVCWRALADNPWTQIALEVVQSLVPDPAPAAAAGAPGPFAFAERARLEQVLPRAGFARTSIERFDAPVALSTGDSPEDDAAAVDFAQQAGPAARLLVGASPALVAEARRAIAKRLEPHRTPRGIVLTGSTWLVEAHVT